MHWTSVNSEAHNWSKHGEYVTMVCVLNHKLNIHITLTPQGSRNIDKDEVLQL